MDRIETFLMKKLGPIELSQLEIINRTNSLLNPRENEQFDSYLTRVVQEVPADSAKKAHKKGEGLCELLDNENFAIIYETLNEKSLIEHWPDDRKFHPLQKSSYANGSSDLIKFFYLIKTCKCFRSNPNDLHKAKRLRISR